MSWPEDSGIKLVDDHLEIRVFRPDWGIAKYITRMPPEMRDKAIQCRADIKEATPENVQGVVSDWQRWAREYMESAGLYRGRGRSKKAKTSAIQTTGNEDRRDEAPAALGDVVAGVAATGARPIQSTGEAARLMSAHVDKLAGKAALVPEDFDEALILKLYRAAVDADWTLQAAADVAYHAGAEAEKCKREAIEAWNALHAAICGDDPNIALKNSYFAQGRSTNE